MGGISGVSETIKNPTPMNMDTDNEMYRRIHFAVMAIESGARKLGISGKEMHDRLSKQGLIHNRLIKRYEELHTQSLDWVSNDICETLLTGSQKHDDTLSWLIYMRDNVLWRKQSRIIMLLADILKISPERALDIYYSTKIYQQMSDPKYGLQLMSDDYVIEELVNELREN